MKKILFLSISAIVLLSGFFYVTSVSYTNANTLGVVYPESKFLDDVEEINLWITQKFNPKGLQPNLSEEELKELGTRLSEYIKSNIKSNKLIQKKIKFLSVQEENPYKVSDEKSITFHLIISHQNKNTGDDSYSLGASQLLIWRPLPEDFKENDLPLIMVPVSELVSGCG